ncbi:MAG TPA: transcriptional regulator [Propionibacterium sp.]|nr:transcriptional regulator [Propionibacterium sp.]
MNEKDDLMFRAASQYYLQGQTMERIARDLRVSRPTVSRLIAQARAAGMVRIAVDPGRRGTPSPHAQALEEAFDIRVHLVPVRATASPAHRLADVARRAASLLADVVADHHTIGVAWGATVAAVAAHLPLRPLEGATVVQMNGGVNRVSSGLPYVSEILQSVGDAFDAEVVLFPVPAFFDHATTRQAMWRERSVRHVRDLLDHLDVAVFGVGSLTAAVPSRVYAAGYLDDVERERLAASGVVGDVCTILLREDGTWDDIDANQRATGLPPTDLARAGRRLCVVADHQRAAALVAALRAGVVTDLVVDTATARAAVARLGQSAGQPLTV